METAPDAGRTPTPPYTDDELNYGDATPLGVVCGALSQAYAEMLYAQQGWTWDLTDTRVAAHERWSGSHGWLALGQTLVAPCFEATREEALAWAASLALAQLDGLSGDAARRWAAWGRLQLAALATAEREVDPAWVKGLETRLRALGPSPSAEAVAAALLSPPGFGGAR